MADSNVLVWTALDLALRDDHRCDAGHRHPHRVVSDGDGGTLVHLPDCPRLAVAERWPADVRIGGQHQLNRGEHPVPD